MRTVTSLLIAALVLLPVERSKSFPVAPFCIALAAVIVAGGVAVYISSCQPKYYCCTSEDEPEPRCRILNMQERRLWDWKVLSGPYKSAELCDQRCSTNRVSRLSGLDGMITITIEKSTDLRNWIACGSVVGDPYCFEFCETNTVNQSYFYRARY